MKASVMQWLACLSWHLAAIAGSWGDRFPQAGHHRTMTIFSGSVLGCVSNCRRFYDTVFAHYGSAG